MMPARPPHISPSLETGRFGGVLAVGATLGGVIGVGGVVGVGVGVEGGGGVGASGVFVGSPQAVSVRAARRMAFTCVHPRRTS